MSRDHVEERLTELAARLDAIAEELAEAAYDALREAAHDGHPDAAALKAERRLLKARRAVEKAAGVLRTGQE
jgi:hypothetical protein